MNHLITQSWPKYLLNTHFQHTPKVPNFFSNFDPTWKILKLKGWITKSNTQTIYYTSSIFILRQIFIHHLICVVKTKILQPQKIELFTHRNLKFELKSVFTHTLSLTILWTISRHQDGQLPGKFHGRHEFTTPTSKEESLTFIGMANCFAKSIPYLAEPEACLASQSLRTDFSGWYSTVTASFMGLFLSLKMHPNLPKISFHWKLSPNCVQSLPKSLYPNFGPT